MPPAFARGATVAAKLLLHLRLYTIIINIHWFKVPSKTLLFQLLCVFSVFPLSFFILNIDSINQRRCILIHTHTTRSLCNYHMYAEIWMSNWHLPFRTYVQIPQKIVRVATIADTALRLVDWWTLLTINHVMQQLLWNICYCTNLNINT